MTLFASYGFRVSEVGNCDSPNNYTPTQGLDESCFLTLPGKLCLSLFILEAKSPLLPGLSGRWFYSPKSKVVYLALIIIYTPLGRLRCSSEPINGSQSLIEPLESILGVLNPCLVY